MLLHRPSPKQHLEPQAASRTERKVPVVSHVAATAAVVLLVALGVFQSLLAGGMPLGRFAWGGQNEVLPGRLRVGSVASIGIYVLIAWVVLSRAGQPGSGSRFLSVAIWVIAGFLLLGAAGN
ncbi:MAG: hypothetical protein ABI083_07975 [Lapillicoccus sp.]